MTAARRLRWPWAVAAGALALWALVWFGGPPLLKSQIEKRGSAALGRQLSAEAIEVSPRLLALTLQGLRVAGPPGVDTEPLLHIERLHLDLHMRSLWRLAPVVESLELQAPKLRLARLGDGHYDVDDLIERFKPAKAPEPASEPARFALFNLQLRDGEVIFEDRPVGRTSRLGDIRLDLPFLSNLPDDVQIKVEPHLAFVLDGSAVDIGGTTTPFAQGRRSSFEIRLDKLPLDGWWVYWPKQLPVRASGGVLDTALNIDFEQHNDGQNAVAVGGRVEVDDVTLLAADDEAPLAQWRKLAVLLDEVRPLERRVALQSVRLDGARVQLHRDARGKLKLPGIGVGEATALAPDTTAVVASAASGASASSSSVASAPGGPPAWKLSLARFDLDDARVEFSDDSTAPPVQLALDAIALSLADVRWPVEADAVLKASARLLAAEQPVGELTLDGAVTDQQARIQVSLKDLQLAPAAPYLRPWLRPRVNGIVSAEARIDWAAGTTTPRQLLDVSALRVVGLTLDESSAPQPAKPGKPAPAAAAVAAVEVAELRADLLQRRLAVGAVRLQRPEFALQRNADGRFDVEQWLVVPPDAGVARVKPVAAPDPAAPTWRAELGELAIEDGRVRFTDAMVGAPPIELAALKLGVEGLAWPLADAAGGWRTRLSAQLLRPGAARKGADEPPATLLWNGQLALKPAAGPGPTSGSAKGELRIERFPVHAFAPYFAQSLPVALQRAEAGFRGQVDVRGSPQALVGELRGDALLADVRVAVRGAGEQAPAPGAGEGDAQGVDPAQLLSWNAMALNGLSVQLQPDAKPRIEITELRLSDYFARLRITEEGRFNLQNVAASSDSPSPTAEAAAPAASGAAASGSRWSNLPVQLVLGEVQLSNGQVDFEDRFVRPNYRAQLSELGGRIGRFDSTRREMASIELSGRVAGTGKLQIGGEINPVANPPALDITAKANDIELPGLTPYASKYAGYPIERGKLSIDVAYKIDEQGKLEARNQIIVNQLKLGPKSDSPDATSLPVKLAVALLQDRNGVIDIDLPLSGSLDDPQFSLGGLIVKAIVNLFTKVITAPFSLLGGGGADGTDLSRIDFQPGTATPTDSSLAAIDKVALALSERPALNVSIAGQADALSEASAMQTAALEQRLRQEQRRERARGSLGNSADAEAPLAPLSAAQRARLVERLYAESRAAQPAAAAASASAAAAPAAGASAPAPTPPPTVAQMEARLAADITIDDAAARALAVERARAVREALIAKGLESERLFLAEPGSVAKAPDNQKSAPPQPIAVLTLAPR